MAGLTIKQEKFCMVYIETGNASEAYRQAYNCKNMSANAIKNEAYKMLESPDISLTVENLKKEHSNRHKLTVDDLVKELEEARQAALNAETVQSSAAVGATMGKAKLLGLVVDKVDAKGIFKVTNVQELTDEQLAAIATGSGQ